ncbi:MAG: LpxI family protein [Desulfovibrionales bacterium]
MSTPLGLIAGEGQFPFLVAEGARSRNRTVVAVAFTGHTCPELKSQVDALQWLRLGQLGKLLNFFKRRDVREVVFAGAINKPKALHLRPDFRAARLLFRLRNKNDNSLLGAVARELESEGLSIVSPLAFAPGLMTPPGVLTRRHPSQRELSDVCFGWPLGKSLGDMDIGQCLVVKEEMVIAVEAMEGTNATIHRAGELAGTGCVVIKVFKPGQEAHIDQPAIGTGTIRTMVEAGATCLAVEARKSLFFDQQESIALADRHGICILGWEAGE